MATTLWGERALRSNEAKWLFCYGTLRDNSVYERLTQSPAPMSLPATLQGWIQFNVPGTAYCGAAPSRFSGAVLGELRRVETVGIWDVLDTYEGNDYLRVPCVVQTAQGSLEAQIYQYDLDHCHRVERLTDNTAWNRIVNEWFRLEDYQSHASLATPDTKSMVEDANFAGIAHVFVMLLNEIPVGSVRLVTRNIPELGELRPWIAGIYVIHELRHLGLGTLLVKALVEKARQLGFHELYLQTEARTQFFEHLGWRTLSTIQVESAKVSLMLRSI
jgi:gamma-glutamylcyclotransferase (GGCT)/AIG2-like uncharacterized protein YtfP